MPVVTISAINPFTHKIQMIETFLFSRLCVTHTLNRKGTGPPLLLGASEASPGSGSIILLHSSCTKHQHQPHLSALLLSLLMEGKTEKNLPEAHKTS